MIRLISTFDLIEISGYNRNQPVKLKVVEKSEISRANESIPPFAEKATN